MTGNAFGDRPSSNGDFRLDLDRSIALLIPARSGVAHSGLISTRFQGVLRSRTFTIQNRFIHYLAAGRGGRINLVVDGFEKIRDPIYGRLTISVNVDDHFRWITQDVSMWLGHRAYVELADGAVADLTGAQTHMADGHGFLAIDQIRVNDEAAAGPTPSYESGPVRLDEVISQLLPKNRHLAEQLNKELVEYRAIQAAIGDPTLALAIADGTGEDESVLIRGNHRNPGKSVPRRFLEVLGGAEHGAASSGSGRLELARRMTDPRANPLLPRVMVNRLWKHHFGEGLVRSVDDFGAMGQKPEHLELLDWLAAEFVAQGWSLKAMTRLIVSSSAYRMSSDGPGESDRLDPANVHFHRMNLRRLDAEVIRDAMLACSGRLDRRMYGPSVPTHLSPFMDGRGRPANSGPLDGDGRRSIYLSVRRNFLNPMFLAFDAPVPFSTMGRRNVSNVPAQALTLMNDPLVIHLAGIWAERLLRDGERTERQRVDLLFQTAFGRAPTAQEMERSLSFLENFPADSAAGNPREAWTNLCHVLINVKEFIYIE